MEKLTLLVNEIAIIVLYVFIIILQSKRSNIHIDTLDQSTGGGIDYLILF